MSVICVVSSKSEQIFIGEVFKVLKETLAFSFFPFLQYLI